MVSGSYIGHTIDYYWEEATTFTRSQFDFITSTMSSAGPPMIMTEVLPNVWLPNVSEKELKMRLSRKQHKQQNRKAKRGYHGRNL